MGDKPSTYFNIPLLILPLLFLCPLAQSQLDPSFYDHSCPALSEIVSYHVGAAVMNEYRMAASLLRLHFHDCIINGCEGSVLLDDTNEFKGEKNAQPNRNSARGFEVIDIIKAHVESACPLTVSCADILALVARDAVHTSGGPYWVVPLGRRDGTTASEKAVLEQMPSPLEPLDKIIAKFTSKGLGLRDVVVLSGAHTIGYAQCFTFKRRLFNFSGSGKPDPSLDPTTLQSLQSTCPNVDGSNSKLAPLDAVSANEFDNVFFKNLMSNRGLLESDQTLMGDQRTTAMVKYYGMYPYKFSYDFSTSMVKLGNVGVLTGQNGQIRMKCGSVN